MTNRTKLTILIGAVAAVIQRPGADSRLLGQAAGPVPLPKREADDYDDELSDYADLNEG